MEQAEEKILHDYFNTYTSLFFKKNDIIVSAGHTSQYVFFIKKGMVRKYLVNAMGNAFVVIWIQENDFFPIFFLNPSINNYYFQASSPVELKRIPKKNLMKFLDTNPKVHMYITNKISHDTANIVDRLEHLLLSEKIEERIQYLILQLAEQFGTNENGKTVINVHLTHGDIAAYIGVARESVTRCLASLVRSGILRIKEGQIIANDLTYLQEKF